MRLFDLSENIAVVTGGNQGIGYAIARGLAMARATVIIANRRAEEGARVSDSLRKEGLKVEAIPTDVRNKSLIEAMVTKTIEKYSKIDILVNNAGMNIRKPIEDYTENDWDQIMETNMKGVFLCTQIVGKEMIRRNKGKIINISSLLSQIAWAHRGIYAASKAGVSHMTRAFAIEWARYNINVNAIGPGPTVSDFNRKYFEQHPDELATFINNTPKKRMGEPSDYVGAAIFLASNASDFVTGQTIIVDGGMTLW